MKRTEEMERMPLMKSLLYAMGYFLLLFFSLSLAWNRYMDMADPPVVNPDVDHSFWLSGLGGWLWFGIAFVLPVVVLLAFSYATRRIWRGAFHLSHAA